MIDIKEVFYKYDDCYLEFDMVGDKLSKRPDLCAFMLIDSLLPDSCCDIVSAAEHDEIYLDVDIDVLAKLATEEDIQTLVRCGVRYDEGYGCLCMFV